MGDAVMMIAASEARDACEGEPDVVKRLEKAMRVTRNFWLSSDDQLRLKAACAAAMLTGSENDKDRIARSFKALATLSAAMSGHPIDGDALAEQMTDDLIPIVRMWHDAKAAA